MSVTRAELLIYPQKWAIKKQPEDPDFFLAGQCVLSLDCLIDVSDDEKTPDGRPVAKVIQVRRITVQ